MADEILQPRNPTQLTVTLLNSRYGAAARDSSNLDMLLPAGERAAVGFTEVTPGVRAEVIGAINEYAQSNGRHLTIDAPNGKAEKVDTLWVVSEGLPIVSSDVSVFPGKVPSRRGERTMRDAGMHAIEATIEETGHRVLLSTERPVPWIRGEKLRLGNIAHMGYMLDEREQDLLTEKVILAVDGGDENHPKGPTEADRALWRDRGYESLMPPGPTYDMRSASRLTRAAFRIGDLIGRLPDPDDPRYLRLDEMYARPGGGWQLVRGETNPAELAPNQIGYTGTIVPFQSTDHYGLRTVFTFPSQK